MGSETAKLNLQYGTISAPVSGLIGDTLVPVGGLVTANSAQPLTTIVPLDPMWVRFKVSESQYLEFQKLSAGSKTPRCSASIVARRQQRVPSRRSHREYAQPGGYEDRDAGNAGAVP